MKELKSITSNHHATLLEVMSRAIDIMKCGKLESEIVINNTRVSVYSLGQNIYTITHVGSMLISLELNGVYCFIL